MKEIKFRGHIKGTNIVADVREIDFTFGKVLMTFVAEDGARTCRYDFHEIELMQFTGLKDKNGIEIYEGDIIQECIVGENIWDGKAVVDITPKGQVVWEDNFVPMFNVHLITIGEVVHSEDGRKGELYLSQWDGVFQWRENKIEIIGNIHETPFLTPHNR